VTAQDRPFAGLNDVAGRCARRKCLRKCTTKKLDHTHDPNPRLGDPCHDGDCWPKEDTA